MTTRDVHPDPLVNTTCWPLRGAVVIIAAMVMAIGSAAAAGQEEAADEQAPSQPPEHLRAPAPEPGAPGAQQLPEGFEQQMPQQAPPPAAPEEGDLDIPMEEAPPPAADEVEPVELPDPAFEVDLPERWTEIEATPSPVPGMRQLGHYGREDEEGRQTGAQVQVQFTSYQQMFQNVDVDRQIYDEEIASNVEMWAEQQQAELIEASLIDDLDEVEAHGDDVAVLDRENRRFQISSLVQEADTPIRQLTLGVFGRHGMYEVVYMDLEDNWERLADERQQILSSFRLTPETAYDETRASPGFFGLDPITIVLLAAAIALIAVVLIGKLKRPASGETELQSEPVTPAGSDTSGDAGTESHATDAASGTSDEPAPDSRRE